jgi:DNA-binding NtrC family response regulator
MDDDPLILDVVSSYFEDKGYTVLVAENGKIGLDLLRFHLPDVVLIDLNMPVINGFGVLDVVATEFPNTPAIIISGEGAMEDVIKALHLGAWHYLTKPIDNLEIIEHAVSQMLEKSLLMKEAEAHRTGLERKLFTIISRFKDYIFTCDDQMTITYMNPALSEYLGGGCTGQSCHDAFFNVHENATWFPVDISHLENERVELKNPVDGRWFEVTCLQILGHDREVYEYQVIMQDITLQKQRMDDLAKREESLRDENSRLLASLTDRYKFGQIVGKSAPMQEVYRTIINAGRSEASVVIYGESGTGKELVARSIHENSERKKHAFVCVNCGAIPENLIESEFFGFKRGAFSGADHDKEGFLDVADKGTLFLDEVGEIPVNLQTKLLRAVDGGGYTPLGGTELRLPDVRIIAATNKDLKELVKTGQVREDFLYRIHVIPIYLPPLRERQSDIPVLIDHFLEKMAPDQEINLPANVLSGLRKYAWPGNVRELQNTIQRFLAIGKIDFIALEEPGDPSALFAHDITGASTLSETMDSVEKRVLIEACKQSGWHLTRTAQALGINRKTLYRKMKHHNIENQG